MNELHIDEALCTRYSRCQYLLGRLRERDDVWDAITDDDLRWLGWKHGAVTVIEAVAESYLGTAAVLRPYPYLARVCEAL